MHPPEAIVRKGPKAIREFLVEHPRWIAADSSKVVYTVYVDDNHHRYEEEWKRSALGVFGDCESAIAACKNVVDSFLFTLQRSPINAMRVEDAGDLVEVYRRRGQDPWVLCDDPSCVFDAWTYAEERCAAIAHAGRESQEVVTYTVYVDDNYHPMDESERYKLGEFWDCGAAIAACRKVVDEFFSNHSAGTAEELLAAYRRNGEDPLYR